jgi:hypothetical protein
VADEPSRARFGYCHCLALFHQPGDDLFLQRQPLLLLGRIETMRYGLNTI